MRLSCVISQLERKVCPMKVGPRADIEHPVSRHDDLVLLLYLMQAYCVGILILLITLDGPYSTYLLATMAANSLYVLFATSSFLIFAKQLLRQNRRNMVIYTQLLL